MAFGAVVAGGGCGASDSEAAGGRAAAYCGSIAEIAALDLLADPTPAAVKSDLEHLLTLTRRAASVAPTEIRSDAGAAASAQDQFNALYAAHDWQTDPTNLDPAFIALSDDPALGALYLRLERYQNRTCSNA